MTESPAFRIQRPQFDATTGIAAFRYALGELQFTETVQLPSGFDPASSGTQNFRLTLDLAAIILGTSYFKLKAPTRIEAPELALTAAGRALVEDVYANGMGEFYARNGLSRFGRLVFDVPPAIATPPIDLPGRALLPIGGGKDSLVSAILAERAGFEFTPFAVNPKGPILTTVERLGIEPVFVERGLDPEMILLSKTPGFYNGHVPATAINSAIAALTALLFGYDTIILSNERSASEGNQLHDGREVNHQHSKSLASERLISHAFAELTGGGLAYFSLLRSYSETRIGQMFSGETRFDTVFSSCNRNFRQTGHDGPLWCGECPKCHFVFLILAPFMQPERMNRIFGQNLLGQPRHLDAYRELSGLAGQKPWECVGEILEAAACLWRLGAEPAWRETAIVAGLHDELENHYGAAKLIAAWTGLMTDSDEHLIPAGLAARMAEHAV